MNSTRLGWVLLVIGLYCGHSDVSAQDQGSESTGKASGAARPGDGAQPGQADPPILVKVMKKPTAKVKGDAIVVGELLRRDDAKVTIRVVETGEDVTYDMKDVAEVTRLQDKEAIERVKPVTKFFAWWLLRTHPDEIVAIMPLIDVGPDLETGECRAWGEQLTTDLQQRGVQLVERSRLDQVIDELGLQGTGLFDPASVKRVGEQVGASVVLVGSLARQDEKRSRLTVRLVDVATGKILKAASSIEPINHALDSIERPYNNQDKPPTSAASRLGVQDPVQPGATWVGNGTSLTILERRGSRFRARLVIGAGITRDISGTIENGQISWLAKDVRALKGNPGGDNFGTIKGDVIDFKWSDQKSGKSGTFSLSRKAP